MSTAKEKTAGVAADTAKAAKPAPAKPAVEKAETVAETLPKMVAVAAAAPAQPAQPAQPAAAAFKDYEDVVQFNRDNVDAAIRAGLVLTRGLQDMNRNLVALAQLQIEESVAASKQLFGARTLQEAVEAQSALVSGGLDRLVAESGRLVEAGMRIAEEAAAPLNARMAVALERIGAGRH